MNRYINAKKVMEEINRIGGHNLCEWDTIGVKALIDRQPTADVVEVRHGEWVFKEYGEDTYTNLTRIYECSLCGRTIECLNEADEPYCHCGAKMDGERKE